MSEMQAELLKRLDALAAKLGTTGQYLWEVMVRGARAQGYADLVLSAIMLVVFVVAATKVKRNIKNVGESGPDVEFTVCLLSGTVAVISGVACLVSLYGAIPSIIAPEAAALSKILSALN